MNTNFNTIEKIQEGNSQNKYADYLAACSQFEIEASQFKNNENFVSRKSAQEVTRAFISAQNADCEYSVYAAAFLAEGWLSKAWNNAD